MVEETNLFRWATSELSQDAFICWLLSWADHGNKSKNPALHQAGLTFLNSLLQLSGQAVVSSETVVVHKQLASADVVAEIGTDRVLLIEDKIDAVEHGDQLDRYLVAIQAHFPGRTILPVFCKTGDQSGYQKPRATGYELFLRRDFLRTLREIKTATLDSDIFSDFLALLESREKATQSYLHNQVGEWSYPSWQGFFLTLQEALPDLEWRYVSNRRGGFMGAWWHFDVWSGWQTYLQIEENVLVMKMGCWETIHPATVRAAIRDRWFEALLLASTGSCVAIRQPARRGNGATMTAARVGNGNSWLQRGENGRLDFQATVAFLREAMVVLDRARADCSLTENAPGTAT